MPLTGKTTPPAPYSLEEFRRFYVDETVRSPAGFGDARALELVMPRATVGNLLHALTKLREADPGLGVRLILTPTFRLGVEFTRVPAVF